MKIKDLFRKVEYPIELYDKNGNMIYLEHIDDEWYIWEHDSCGNIIYYKNSSGYSEEAEYDTDGYRIYYEDSRGRIIDNRAKEMTVAEINEKLGHKIKVVE